MVNDLCRNTNTTDIMQVIHQLRVATNVYRFKRYKPRLKKAKRNYEGKDGRDPVYGRQRLHSVTKNYLPSRGRYPTSLRKDKFWLTLA